MGNKLSPCYAGDDVIVTASYKKSRNLNCQGASNFLDPPQDPPTFTPVVVPLLVTHMYPTIQYLYAMRRSWCFLSRLTVIWATRLLMAACVFKPKSPIVF
ncbi:hypothetical protein BO83DRAFT_19992 [Aspergillus eucalypticola CBS 122712]|uniref:Uncharacterized protein n=1 Tax=Aspergillus eucalypticola (strain CBS 122712 / IBT 29274) TaxID=1448314 RepID=A0A317VQ19_ASPEC|nr:uncharacterized protein BO83DRAFT_19992 [Aspergillus eucalypticola CBS 122712]PWY74978.1 hypothetical protein BO83DRAFT_19992 [Aspergillus eucalypticola CBS 122712]